MNGLETQDKIDVPDQFPGLSFFRVFKEMADIPVIRNHSGMTPV